MTRTMKCEAYFCWARFVYSWILIWVISSTWCADAGYTVHGPANHVAFTSNVVVGYQTASDQSIGQLVLQLYDVSTDTGLIKKTITETIGEIVFECSRFDHAGVYAVRMLDELDNIVAESQNIVVRWPLYTFDVPESAKTLSDLKIYAQTNEVLCTDLVYNRFEINFVLFFLGSESSGSNEQPLQESLEVGRIDVRSLSDEMQAVFSCDSVAKGGFYTVKLESSFQNSILTVSDNFQVSVSPSVDLSFSERSTANCVDFLNITYSTPESCNFQPKTIGVYTISPPETSLTDPSVSSLGLVEEVDASLGREISLPCETFANDVYTGYCFKFEGRSGSGAVLEPVVRCLPTRQLVNGGWGHWSEWGDCSTSCGDSIRYRRRVCDSPAPANGGEDCVGNPVNVASCEVPKCPEYDDSFPHIVSRDVDEESATPSSCNYVLSTSNGNLLASPQSCPSGATWVIRVANNKRIRVEFITFNLYLPQEYVRIRDGINARAKVLAFHTGQLIPDTVTSTGSQIYVEYEVFAKGKPPERGFSASYTSLDLPKSPPPTVAGALANDSSEGGLSNHSTIILAVGVSLLVLMLLLSLIMTIIIRFKEERQQFTGGNIQKIYTGPRGSFNSSTTRSNQRLFGVPGHSTTSPSEHSHQSVSKRGFPDGNGTGAGTGDRSQMYLIPENTNMQYLPETALSPPYKGSSEIQTISELPSPYKEETGPKWPVPKKDLSLPFHFGNPNQSMDDFSRQSEIMTDKNTIHLANKTPSEYATRGYSAHGSTRGSRSSVDSRPNDMNRHKRIVAKVENSDNTSPFVSPNGELTPEGLNATGKMHKRPTRLNRSPEGAESPENLQNGGTLTRSNHGPGYHSSERKHKSHRSGTRSSKSGLSSDAGMYSPDSTAERSGGSKSGSGRHSKGHRHHSHHAGNRRKSPSREENISMKDMNSSRTSHSKRRHSPSSPRSKSKQSELKSPRSPRSHSSSGSGRKYRPHLNSRSPTKHGGKLYSPPASDNSRYNSLPYSYHGTDSSLGNLSPTSDPSPIRLPKPLSMKQNRDQLKQVFISDESLMNKVASGPERSGAESSRSGVSSSRQLPTTPSSGSGSPTKSHHARRVYSDKSLSPEEPAFDNYMPSIPGSFFENPYPQPIPNGPTAGNHGNLSVV